MTLILWLLIPACYGFHNINIGIFRPVQNNSLAFLDDLWLQRFSELLHPSPIYRKSHRLQKRFEMVDLENNSETIPQNWIKRQWNRLSNFLWNRRLSSDIVTMDSMECPICYRESDFFEQVIETSNSK